MEAELAVAAKMIVLSLFVGGFMFFISYLCELLLLRPKSIRSKLEKQGIRGPPPSFLIGNLPEMKRLQSKKGQSTETKTDDDDDHAASISHQWHLKLFPHIEQWRNEFGMCGLLSSSSMLFSLLETLFW